MTEFFWILMLSIFLGGSCLAIAIIIIYYRVINKIKNGLVQRIFNADNTFSTYRYDKLPIDDKLVVTEYDTKGEETSFTYQVLQKCIRQGKWGRYIDYDYHVMLPINPADRNPNNFLSEVKEFFKQVGAMLDTDLHVKLLRNSKFESFVKVMLMIIIIIASITMVSSLTGTIKSFFVSNADNVCILKLDNQTWQTIYIASHQPSPSMTAVPVSGKK